MAKVLFACVSLCLICTPAYSAKKARPALRLEKALNKALINLRIAPEEPRHYFITANLYKRLKKPLKAASIYKRLLGNNLIKDSQTRFKGAFYLASIYLFDKKFKKSILYYREALEINPMSTPARLNLGTALLNAKSYIAALNEYQHVLNNNPNYAIIYFNVAKCYEKLRKFPQAREHYRTFLSIVEKDGARSFKKYNKYIQLAKKTLYGNKRIKPKILRNPKVIKMPQQIQ